MFEFTTLYDKWKEASVALDELDPEIYPGLTAFCMDTIEKSEEAVIELTDGAISSLKILEIITNAWKNNQCYPLRNLENGGKIKEIVFTDLDKAKELVDAFITEGTDIKKVNMEHDFKFCIEYDKITKDEAEAEDEGIVTYSYELDLDEFYDIKSKEEGYPYAEAAFNEVFPEDIREYVREEWEMRWNLTDGKNFLISNILSNPDVYTCLKGKVKKQQELINIINSWWDSLLLFVEGFLEGCDDDNAEALNKMVHAFVEDPVTEDGKIKEEKLDEVIDVIFDLFISKNQDSEFKMFLSQPEIKSEFCKLVRDLSLKMEAGASYEDVMAEALPSVVALMTKKVEA